jgi:transposase-like protein
MKNWTPEDRQTALSMRAAGKTFAEIGQALGRKGKNVKSFVNDLQRRDPDYVRSKPHSFDWSTSKIDEAFARIADGDSINAVAAYFGVGKTTISRMLFKQKAHGRIPDRPKMDKTKPAAQKRYSVTNVAPYVPKNIQHPPMNPVGLFKRTGCCFPINNGRPYLYCNNPGQCYDESVYCDFHKTELRKW